MHSWSVRDAKARFSEWLAACLSEGPQLLTRRGAEAAVLVPADEWRRLQAAARPSLKQLMLAAEARAELVLLRLVARAASACRRTLSIYHATHQIEHLMSLKLSKSDAMARLNRERPILNLESSTTHFASINASKEVWWYDIPCKKVTTGRHEVLHLLAHDHRCSELHHLVVPTKYFRDNLSKLLVREDKDSISLELSANRSTFLQDVRPGAGRIHFAQFRQD